MMDDVGEPQTPVFSRYGDYEDPLLEILAEQPNGEATTAFVMGEFWRRHAASIPVEHRALLASSKNELKWQNMIRWARRTLLDRGWLESPARGVWRISAAGRDHLGSRQNGVVMLPLQTYADYEVPLLQTLAGFPDGQGKARDIVMEFERQFGSRILPEHRMPLKSRPRELKWQNIVYWTRNNLVTRGLMAAPAYGIWAITEAGRATLAEAGKPASFVGPPPTSQPVQTPDRAITFVAEAPTTKSPQGELTKAAFIERARAALERLLTDSGQAVTLLVHRDRLVQVHFSSFSGCHYELWVHAHSIELGLHFESSQKLNYARLAAFVPHQDALKDALGEQLRVAKWGQGCAKVFSEFPRPPLTLALADEHATRLHGLIKETLPILREAFARKAERPRVEARSEPPTRAHAIIDAQIAAIRDFLNGRAGRPSDERLCDWVQLCYEFELYREGRDLFALVDPAQVNSWYYERAKRSAKICAMKVAGHA